MFTCPAVEGLPSSDIYLSAVLPSTDHLSSPISELFTFTSTHHSVSYFDSFDTLFLYSGLSSSPSEHLLILKDSAQMPFVTCLCPEKA